MVGALSGLMNKVAYESSDGGSAIGWDGDTVTIEVGWVVSVFYCACGVTTSVVGTGRRPAFSLPECFKVSPCACGEASTEWSTW